MLDEQNTNWKELYDRANLFQRADAISIKVGLILTPLLFGAFGVSVLYFMSAPLSNWVAVSSFGAGILLFIFILYYAKKAKNKRHYVLIGTLTGIVKIRAHVGEASSSLKIDVTTAFELTPDGKGNQLHQYNNTKVNRLFVLKNHQAEDEIRALQGELIFLCVPNGHVVGFVDNGRLTEYKF